MEKDNRASSNLREIWNCLYKNCLYHLKVSIPSKDEQIKQLQAELDERKKQLEIAFEILEKYTPTEKLQQANDEMILKVKGVREEMGRDLLTKP
ncbi:unnamed protein product [marine sediment metagenome]|uniref:Uncharacterized protein n=1 Tax=marine sediment metagenome TaxID=412755 RepID=X1PNF9_9ZZZZ